MTLRLEKNYIIIALVVFAASTAAATVTATITTTSYITYKFTRYVKIKNV